MLALLAAAALASVPTPTCTATSGRYFIQVNDPRFSFPTAGPSWVVTVTEGDDPLLTVTATPTPEPTREQFRRAVLGIVDTIESDKKRAGTWNDEDETESRWLRTWWANPPATRTPTPNAEATCVAVGHKWTGNWTNLHNPHSNLGGYVWPEEAHLEVSVKATKPDHDTAWFKEAQRCLRCGLWRRKP